MPTAMLHRDPDRHHNEGVDGDVEKELDELEAIALRVVRREAANERDRALIKSKLPELRKKGVGPAKLEQRIHRVFVAGTISLWTREYGRPRRKSTAAADS
jgi:hypothetical protein